MFAVLITFTVFGAVMYAYSFLGRSLIRLGYSGQLESDSRKTLYTFSQDVGAAQAVTTAGSSQLVMTLPSGTVTYTYSSTAATLTRTLGTATTTLLTGVTKLGFDYFDVNANSTSTTSVVKLIDVTFTTAAGVTTSGSLAQYAVASPRVMMRNKAYLQ